MMNKTPRFLSSQVLGRTLIVTALSDLTELEFETIDREAIGILDQFKAEQLQHLVLDLNQTNYAGSTAIGLFIQLWQPVKMQNGRMAVCHLSDHQREVLKTCHLDHRWPLCNTLREALEIVEPEISAE